MTPAFSAVPSCLFLRGLARACPFVSSCRLWRDACRASSAPTAKPFSPSFRSILIDLSTSCDKRLLGRLGCSESSRLPRREPSGVRFRLCDSGVRSTDEDVVRVCFWRLGGEMDRSRGTCPPSSSSSVDAISASSSSAWSRTVMRGRLGRSRAREASRDRSIMLMTGKACWPLAGVESRRMSSPSYKTSVTRFYPWPFTYQGKWSPYKNVSSSPLSSRPTHTERHPNRTHSHR
jgi:hypothetical protein